MIPSLAKILAAPKSKDASDERSRVEAINALAGLTRDDRRFFADGRPRAVDDVVLDYLSSPPK